MAKKNVKQLPGVDITSLVTTREGLLKVLDENQVAYERYTAAKKDLDKTDKSIITFLREAGKATVRVLGYILNLIEEAVTPKKVVIGVNELQVGLEARGFHKERDLVEDVLNELKEAKEAKNIEEAAGQFNYGLEVVEARRSAVG
jgi:hypothetical protein